MTRVDQFMLKLSRAMAYLGGIVLLLITLIVCLSILGRSLITIAHLENIETGLPWLSHFIVSLGIGPINGDYELVEAGMAFAIFAFLPFCQTVRGHATVDLFTSGLPANANRFIDVIAELLLAGLLLLLAWRMWIGMTDKLRYGETTFSLQFPVWWAYAIAELAAIVAAGIALWMVSVRLREWLYGKPLLAKTRSEMQ